MANGIDQSLLQAGRRGAEFVQAPSLFDQALPGLFSNQSTIRFDETQGGRFKKFFLGGLFGPTKKEREAHAREQKAEAAATKVRAQGIAGQIRTAGRGDALSFPAVRDIVQLASTGDEESLRSVAGIIGNQTAGQRAQGIERQRVADESAQLQLEQAQLAAEGGVFGSHIDSDRFFAIRDKVGTQVAGASSLRNIHDTVKNLTDVQMAAIGSGAGGEIQGQIEAELFSLMRSMQTLLESGEGSVLRKSDQELIEAALGDPSSFIGNVFSREAKTLGALNRFSEILLESAGRELVGLDAKTIGLLSPVLQMAPSPFARPEGPERDAPPVTGGSTLFPGAPISDEDILTPLQEGAKSLLNILTPGRG